MNALVWLCASFPLLSVLLLCSACAFPGCISSFIWEGVLLVGKMLALQFLISPFSPILLHHSNPNILSSVVRPCSVPWFFWGLLLGASFSSGIDSLWMQCGASSIGIWRHRFARGICSLQFLPLPELQARAQAAVLPGSRFLLVCLRGSSYQLFLGFSWHPWASGREKPGMAPCEDCQTLPETFPWSSFPGSLRSFLTCSVPADAVTSGDHSEQPMLVLVCGKRKSMAASYFLEAIVLFTKHVCRAWFFWTQAGESSRKPFFSIIQGRFFLPALNSLVEFSVTFTVSVSLDVLDFLLLSWCSSLTFLALDLCIPSCSLQFVYFPLLPTQSPTFCVCVQSLGIFFSSVCGQCCWL